MADTLELRGLFDHSGRSAHGLKWVNARNKLSLEKEPWIRRHPVEAVKHWQQLYKQRVRGSSSRTINQDLCVMTESMGGLMHQLACGKQISETSIETLFGRDASDPEDLALISALLKAGLREVCATIISAEDFALERFAFIARTLQIVYCLVALCYRDVRIEKGWPQITLDSVHTIRDILSPLWGHMWKHRELLTEGATYADQLTLENQRQALFTDLFDKHILWSYLSRLPMIYFPSLEGQESHRLPDTNDPRRLMLYIRYHHPELDTKTWLCSGDSLVVYTCRSLQCAKGTLQAFEAFIADDIIAEYNPVDFLTRVSRTLRNPQLIDDELYVVAAYVGHAIMSPAFHHHFVASGAFSAIREAIDRQRTKGLQDGDSQWRTFEELLTVLRAVSEDAPFNKGMGAMLQPPCNVIELIARSFIFSTRTTRPSYDNREQEAWPSTISTLDIRETPPRSG